MVENRVNDQQARASLCLFNNDSVVNETVEAAVRGGVWSK